MHACTYLASLTYNRFNLLFIYFKRLKEKEKRRCVLDIDDSY